MVCGNGIHFWQYNGVVAPDCGMVRFSEFAYFICIEILIYCGYVNFLFDPQMGQRRTTDTGGRSDDRDFRCIKCIMWMEFKYLFGRMMIDRQIDGGVGRAEHADPVNWDLFCQKFESVCGLRYDTIMMIRRVKAK